MPLNHESSWQSGSQAGWLACLAAGFLLLNGCSTSAPPSPASFPIASSAQPDLSVGARLSHALRGDDFASRHGGDEFVCLLPDVQGEVQALGVARTAISAPGRARCERSVMAAS